MSTLAELQQQQQILLQQMLLLQQRIRDNRAAQDDIRQQQDACRHKLAAAILRGCKRRDFDSIPQEVLAEAVPPQDLDRLREVRLLVGRINREVSLSWVTQQEVAPGVWEDNDDAFETLPMDHPAAAAVLALKDLL